VSLKIWSCIRITLIQADLIISVKSVLHPGTTLPTIPTSPNHAVRINAFECTFSSLLFQSCLAGVTYTVQGSGSWKSCTCAVGLKGYVCKHLVKAEQLALHSNEDLHARFGVTMGSSARSINLDSEVTLTIIW